ncbi:MAG TPA: Fe-S protein assembly co-chaperone HscB [Acidobacteriota bacterium]|jgi:molecular chaperone HscB
MQQICWNCRRGIGEPHFCPYCGKIQPATQSDYFAFLGFARSPKLDLRELEERFHDLSRKLHPDRFFRSSEQERALSMEQSSRLNDAYRTLRNPVLRAEYLLSLYGMKPQMKQQQPPEDLLEEVFGLKEEIGNLQAARKAADKEAMASLSEQMRQIKSDLRERIQQLDSELAGAGEEWERSLVNGSAVQPRVSGPSPVTGDQSSVLRKLQQNLLKRSYIENLIRQIEAENL